MEEGVPITKHVPKDIIPEEQHRKITCPKVGELDVYIQGTRASNEVVILTVHDLGCDHTMYRDFISHESMANIRGRTVWVHVDVPGQGQDASDLPTDYEFPSMDGIAGALIHVIDELKVREVICFGEGAGANILARFAVAHPEKTLGVVLLHCTGSTAGFMESVKDLFVNWKLERSGMNTTAESYLMIHRFGSFHKASNNDSLMSVMESHKEKLKKHTNAKNLKKFVEAFLKRTDISHSVKKINCPVLFVTGGKSVFRSTTRQMHQTVMRAASDKGKIDLLEISGCANVLEETPVKFIESFQYFLQGCGLVSSLPMHHLKRMARTRAMSMEDFDLPRNVRARNASGSGAPKPAAGAVDAAASATNV